MNKEIQAELLRIAKVNNGLLTPVAVVEAAESKDSPLHTLFTWDDDDAARLWRLHEARNIILKIQIDVQTVKDEVITVRAWTSLTPDRKNEDGGYRETIRIMRSGDMRNQLLADAMADMDRFTEKYRTLSELAGVFKAMRKARKG